MNDNASSSPAPSPAPKGHASTRLFFTLLLLAAGLQCWLFFTGDEPLGDKKVLAGIALAGAAGALVAAIAPTRRLALRILESLRHPSTPTRCITALLLIGLSGAYLYHTARQIGRSFSPIIHDEHAYIIQSRMIAQGKLWMPKHELSDFFESFHLLTDRKYAAKYPPGTAIMLAPGVLMGLPHWVMPLAIASIGVGLMYLVFTRWIDGLCGLLASLMLVGLPIFRRISLDALSQGPMLLLALLALWAYLHWKASYRSRWLALLGLAIGWGAITRPVDALALAIPLAIAVFIELRHVPRKAALTGLFAATLAALPFAAILLIFNHGVTGSATTLTWNHYAKLNDPYDTLSAMPVTPMALPQSNLPQKVQFAREFTYHSYLANRKTSTTTRLIEGRLTPALFIALDSPWLLVLLPLGIVAMLSRQRWIALAMLLIFLTIYTFYTFFIANYAVVMAIPLTLIALAGFDRLATALPATRIIGAALLLAIAVTSMPQVQYRMNEEQWPHPPILRQVDQRLASLDATPSIVLFRFDRRNGYVHCEPVYNITTAWPDDARIIRAHDRTILPVDPTPAWHLIGQLWPTYPSDPSANLPLFRYYARHAPDRKVYLFDMSRLDHENPLTYLGTARSLAP